MKQVIRVVLFAIIATTVPAAVAAQSDEPAWDITATVGTSTTLELDLPRTDLLLHHYIDGPGASNTYVEVAAGLTLPWFGEYLLGPAGLARFQFSDRVGIANAVRVYQHAETNDWYFAAEARVPIVLRDQKSYIGVAIPYWAEPTDSGERGFAAGFGGRLHLDVINFFLVDLALGYGLSAQARRSGGWDHVYFEASFGLSLIRGIVALTE